MNRAAPRTIQCWNAVAGKQRRAVNRFRPGPEFGTMQTQRQFNDYASRILPGKEPGKQEMQWHVFFT
jgi:hypothetical protein